MHAEPGGLSYCFSRKKRLSLLVTDKSTCLFPFVVVGALVTATQFVVVKSRFCSRPKPVAFVGQERKYCCWTLCRLTRPQEARHRSLPLARGKGNCLPPRVCCHPPMKMRSARRHRSRCSTPK